MMEYLAMALAIGGGAYALSARQLMRSVLALAVFFCGIAIWFGLLDAWFLAVGQIFLFVGGVVTLFVLAFNMANAPIQRPRLIPLALALCVIATLFIFLPDSAASASAPIGLFASHFFATYGWMLNIALLLLFSAVIAAQYLLEVRE